MSDASAIEIAPYAAIAAAVIASVGLWWFQLIMVSVRKSPKRTRYAVYAGVWLAYFVLVMIVILQNYHTGPAT